MVQNGSYSNYTSVESGVPQGSVLGPLFLVYINDLERYIKSNVMFFLLTTPCFCTSANDLNHDLTSFISGPINGIGI